MCADGLKGLKEAINAVYPKTEFQRCIVHLIRNTMKYVSYKDRKELATDLKLIYTASSEKEAYKNLQELKEKWAPRKISLAIGKGPNESYDIDDKHIEISNHFSNTDLKQEK